MKKLISISIVLALLLTLLIAATPAGAEGKGKGKDKAKDKEKDKEKVTICHQPGTPAQKTMEVPESALDGHLGHGDYEGECTDEPPEGTSEPGEGEKVTVCHKPGTVAEKTLEIDAADLEDHLAHGDYEGECTDEPPEGWSGPTDKATICHKPDTPAEKTLVIDADDVEDHLAHGDYEGECEESEASPDWGLPSHIWNGQALPVPI